MALTRSSVPEQAALTPRIASVTKLTRALHARGGPARSRHPLVPPPLPRLVEQAYRQLLDQDARGALGALAAAVALLRGEDARELTAADAAGPWQATTRMQPRARIVIHTLGRFEVLVDGAPLCTGRKQPRRTLALLKALVALGGRHVARSTLVDALWPDLEGDLGQNALEVTLHRLRARLGVPEAIVARNGCLDLDPAVVWADALAFGACPQDDPECIRSAGASITLETAFALYGGLFLPDDRDGSWSLRMRERLRARFVRIVAETGARLEASGQLQAASRVYERALAVDDLACVFHDGLARCLAQLGRPGEARMARERGHHVQDVEA